ncbi:MAG: hypothetical protein U5L07_07860 [Desulfobacterales bacterium]|nr:hypothetical protein [Desulfobacterales bacterium]
MTPQEQKKQMFKSTLLQVMTEHVGRENAIGMGELYDRVICEPWTHRINDTRYLRKLLTELRRDGVPICSSASREGGGYYLAAAGSELARYCENLHRRALSLLSREARLKKMTLPELVGQLSLETD